MTPLIRTQAVVRSSDKLKKNERNHLRMRYIHQWNKQTGTVDQVHTFNETYTYTAHNAGQYLQQVLVGWSWNTKLSNAKIYQTMLYGILPDRIHIVCSAYHTNQEETWEIHTDHKQILFVNSNNILLCVPLGSITNKSIQTIFTRFTCTRKHTKSWSHIQIPK